MINLLEQPIILQAADAVLTSYLQSELQKRGRFISADQYRALKLGEQQSLQQQVSCIVAIGRSRLDAAYLEQFPQLKLIAVCGAGFDQIDVAYCLKHNIAVSNTPYISSDDVADFAFMLILNLLRRGYSAQEFVQSGKWSEGQVFPLTVRVSSKKIGIAGLGHIGSAVAQRALGFNMPVGYFSRTRKSVSFQYYSNLHELAQWCDILVLCMSANSENRHIVDAEILQALGAKGYLINIARGSLINEQDLLRSLKQGTIAGFAGDVFEHEPAPYECFEGTNSVLTPHVASATAEARLNMSDLTLQNIDAFISSGKVLTPVRGL